MEFELTPIVENGKYEVKNFNNTKEALKMQLQSYDYVVDENNLKQAKKEKATLNGIAKKINDTRIKMEKEYMDQGFTSFKNQMRELTDMVKKVSDKMNAQIKEIEPPKLKVKEPTLTDYLKKIDDKEEKFSINKDKKGYQVKVGTTVYPKMKTLTEALRQYYIDNE